MTFETNALKHRKPKKWRPHAAAHQQESPAQLGKNRKHMNQQTVASNNDEAGQETELPSVHTMSMAKRRPLADVSQNVHASDSENEGSKSTTDVKSRNQRINKTPAKSGKKETVRHPANRDRARKTPPSAPRAKKSESMLTSLPSNNELQSREASFVTEGGASSLANDDQIPRSSSPILAPNGTAKSEQTQGPKAENSIADRSLSASTGNESIRSNNGQRAFRGIVAEMHAHERRQVRLAGQANKQTTNAASRLLEQLRTTSNLGTPPDPTVGTSNVSAANAPSMHTPTFYPFGIPTVSNANAVLSPYGLSPYAEPGSSWTTNVYVNNLPPHTSDDDLLRLGSCFGRVKSHKAIINQETGLCKGYGFIMYEFLHDAELAIQQLPLHGLSTSWAKESFSSKLRRMADSTTSNVYLSNLPQDITPSQLEKLFLPHNVVSLRILTDPATGQSRGVGFVRLRDRLVAQECIERLNGMTIPGQESPLQARYADSEAQKQFKHCARAQLSKTDQTQEVGQSGNGQSATPMGSNDVTQPVFVAALQGQPHSWTGFATPTSNTSGFSPLLGLMSPQTGVAGFPSANDGHSALPPHMTLNHALAYQNGLHHQIPAVASIDPAFLNLQNNEILDPLTTHRLQWMAASHQLRANSQLVSRSKSAGEETVDVKTGTGDPVQDRNDALQKARPTTFLPPDLAMQHARALMETNAQLKTMAGNPSIPSKARDSESLTQEYVERERADLLNALKETSEKLARSQQATATDATDRNGACTVRPIHDENAGEIKPFGIHKTNTSTMHVAPRRLSNSGTLFDPETGKQKDFAYPSGATMRSSLSAASLSPLRFLYSQDPKVPISVEAVDLTRMAEGVAPVASKDTSDKAAKADVVESEGAKCEENAANEADDTSATVAELRATAPEEDNHNTTADSGEGHAESSYSTTNSTFNMEEEDESVNSAISMRKSDSGKDFRCQKGGDEYHNVDGKDAGACLKSASMNVSPLIVGIMAAASAAQTQEKDDGKQQHPHANRPDSQQQPNQQQQRNRSKSVMIHVPLD